MKLTCRLQYPTLVLVVPKCNEMTFTQVTFPVLAMDIGRCRSAAPTTLRADGISSSEGPPLEEETIQVLAEYHKVSKP